MIKSLIFFIMLIVKTLKKKFTLYFTSKTSYSIPLIFHPFFFTNFNVKMPLCYFSNSF